MSGTRVSRVAAAALVSAAAALTLSATLSAQSAPPAAEPIRPGEAVAVTLEIGQSRVFEIPLRRGELLEGALELLTPNDPATTLRSPAGAILFQVERVWPGADQPFWAVAPEDGTYRLEVRAPERAASSVRFRIRIEVPHPAGETDRLRAEAFAIHASAVTSIDRGDWKGSIPIFEKARRLWERAGDARGEAQTLHMLGFVLQRDLSPMALGAYERALELRRRAGDGVGEALTLKNIAEHHRRASRLDEAEAFLDRSIEAWRLAGDRAGEAGSTSNLAILSMMRGDYRKALDLFGEALAIQEALSDVDGQARSLSNMSTAYRSLGELGQALDSAERSLPLRRRVSDKRGEAYSLGNIGDTWRALGEPERALAFDMQAFETLREAKDPAGGAEFQISIAQSQMALGNDEEALAALEKTTSFSRKAGIPRLEGRALGLAGDLLARRGAHRDAIARYEAALRVMEGAPDRTYETATLAGACRSLVALGEPDRAEPFCRRAAELAATLHLPALEARALIAQADLDRAQGQLRAAAGELDSAFLMMETLRDRVPQSERASYMADRQKPYRFWLDVLAALDRGSPEEGWDRRAFHASERLKARALLEDVVEARGDVAQSVDPKLGQRRRELEASLGVIQRALSDPKLPEAERAKLSGRPAEREAEYESLVREISRRAPSRAALRYPRPAGAVEVSALLAEGVALLAYALGEKSATAFVLTREGFRAVALSADPRELERRVRNYTELLSRREGAASKIAARLGRDLLAPVAAAIPASIQRLVIAPDGPLHALPFEALPGIRGGATLLDELSVSYVPSATLHVALHGARRAVPPAALLVLADPATGVAPPDAARLRFLYECEGLSAGALPHATREARALSRLSGRGSEVYVGSAAEEGRVKKELSRFGVLHFATHGFVSERHPARSALLLAAHGSEDGFLQAREIANLRVAADLVVLSGCRTARGRLLAGEGPQSLARAFFQAGAASVVASLWDVGDEATAVLMERFYSGLAAGQSRTEALRAAKRSLSREGLPPGDWAAFVLLGDGEGGVRLEPPPPWKGWLIPVLLAGGGAVVATVFLSARRRGRKRRSGIGDRLSVTGALE